jgi:MbtH protein
MAQDDEDDKTVYRVVVNDEEQYSIWPEFRDLPPGWREAGKSGPKSECLAFIEQVWTDMRPRSLRQAMDRAKADPTNPPA